MERKGGRERVRQRQTDRQTDSEGDRANMHGKGLSCTQSFDIGFNQGSLTEGE